MNRRIIEMELPLGNPYSSRNCYYDPVTAALVVTTVAAGAGALEARKSRKAASAQAARTEEAAKKAQAKTESLATEEKAAADKKLQEARSRVLIGQGGRGSLLFGTEKGVETKQTTLGV